MIVERHHVLCGNTIENDNTQEVNKRWTGDEFLEEIMSPRMQPVATRTPNEGGGERLQRVAKVVTKTSIKFAIFPRRSGTG